MTGFGGASGAQRLAHVSFPGPCGETLSLRPFSAFWSLAPKLNRPAPTVRSVVKAEPRVLLDKPEARTTRRVRLLEREAQRLRRVTRLVFVAISSVVARDVRFRRRVPRFITGVSGTMRAWTSTCV